MAHSGTAMYGIRGRLTCSCTHPNGLAGSAEITSSASETQPNFIARLRSVAACRSGAKLETASATTVVA